MQVYRDSSKEILIQAKELSISETASFGQNIHINVKGVFHIGDRSILGNDVEIEGRNVSIGTDLYHSRGLRIGGGGHTNPTANFSIGDRCTIHNNYINIAEAITIGNDVGLSPDVTIQTHGYWLSVLEGFPAKFAGVTIDDGVIVGYRSMILMGVHICENIVVGAGSVVTKDLTKRNGIYAGNPAKFIREVVPLLKQRRIEMIDHIINQYKKIAIYHGIDPVISVLYPIIVVNGCVFNLEKLEFTGNEDEETDDFRDYIRKWGLRFYSNRPFKNVYEI